MHIAWTSKCPEHGLQALSSYSTISDPSGLQTQSGHNAQCSHGTLPPIPHQVASTHDPSPFQVCARHLPDAVPRIYTLIHDSRHSPARETHSCCGVGSHHAHRTGCISGHSKPCRWDCPAPCAVRRIQRVTHLKEKQLCSAVTGKQLEQRASLSSQSDRGKGNRNFRLSKQKESYSQCGNRGKGSF